MTQMDYPRYPSQRNKRVFVTGGGSGIGAEIVANMALLLGAHDSRKLTAREFVVDAGSA